ncbi:MAG: hypothetical protein BWZ02_02639 [Lentisphaerae bacterium ADurb.BinA184]|nr:MAG: hypothetical protein BWZ02_02639 [Lentisphaerae bacterium ADurb.BinA184]
MTAPSCCTPAAEARAPTTGENLREHRLHVVERRPTTHSKQGASPADSTGSRTHDHGVSVLRSPNHRSRVTGHRSPVPGITGRVRRLQDPRPTTYDPRCLPCPLSDSSSAAPASTGANTWESWPGPPSRRPSSAAPSCWAARWMRSCATPPSPGSAKPPWLWIPTAASSWPTWRSGCRHASVNPPQWRRFCACGRWRPPSPEKPTPPGGRPRPAASRRSALTSASGGSHSPPARRRPMTRCSSTRASPAISACRSVTPSPSGSRCRRPCPAMPRWPAGGTRGTGAPL